MKARACERHTVAWLRWLRAAGLPAAHCAFVLGLDPVEADSLLRRPWYASPWRLNSSCNRAVKGDTADKIRRLDELGYPPARIAAFLVLTVRAVEDFLRRITPVRGASLRKPRTAKRQRAADRYSRRKAQTAAVAAERAKWRRCDSPSDDGAPPAEASPDHGQAVELLKQTPPAEAPALPEPTRWHQRGDERTRFGESSGRAKLAWSDVVEIRGLHSEGVSCYALARRFGVTSNTISNIVTGRSWQEPGQRDESPAPPPPPAEPPVRKPQEGHRWQRMPHDYRLAEVPAHGQAVELVDESPPAAAPPAIAEPTRWHGPVSPNATNCKPVTWSYVVRALNGDQPSADELSPLPCPALDDAENP